jgi:hypothetical protein
MAAICDAGYISMQMACSSLMMENSWLLAIDDDMTLECGTSTYRHNDQYILLIVLAYAHAAMFSPALTDGFLINVPGLTAAIH